MADISGNIPGEGSGEILSPMRLKTESFWHCYGHSDDGSALMVKYRYNIYVDRTCDISIVEEMSRKEYFSRQLKDTL